MMVKLKGFDKNMKYKNFLNIFTVLTVIIILISFNNYVYISGSSMYPTLENGNFYVKEKASPGNLKLGDIVLANVEDKQVVKRIVAISGDTLRFIDKDSGTQLKLNNSIIEDSIFGIPEQPLYEHPTKPIEVSKNHVYLLGDNRIRSNDSRDFGAVSLENIEGILIPRNITKQIYILVTIVIVYITFILYINDHKKEETTNESIKGVQRRKNSSNRNAWQR